MERWRLLKNPRVLAGLGLAAVLLAASLWPATVTVDVARVTRGPLLVTVDEAARRGSPRRCMRCRTALRRLPSAS